jgi:CRP-like cAMP-binding protein
MKSTHASGRPFSARTCSNPIAGLDFFRPTRLKQKVARTSDKASRIFSRPTEKFPPRPSACAGRTPPSSLQVGRHDDCLLSLRVLLDPEMGPTALERMPMLESTIDHVQTDLDAFDAKAFLDAGGIAGCVVDYRPGETIHEQGDPSDTVLYIQHGSVKLSVMSRTGKEAIVGLLGDSEFCGEEALAGRPTRAATASAMTATRIRVVPKRQMIELLHEQHALADRFIAHLLARNSRLEEDLVDQLFNAVEKRLARTLLLLARYGKANRPQPVLSPIPQEVLAEMVGTSRSRVNLFMNKFRKFGFIDYDSNGITVHSALLSAVLRDGSGPGP